MFGGITQDLPARIAVSEKIIAVKRELADKVNQEFFRRHPEWKEIYGALGVQRGFEDACYHLDYLAAAVETGSFQLFETYARWTARVLESRGIAPCFVLENLEQIQKALPSRLLPQEFTIVEPHIQAAINALSDPAGPKGGETRAVESKELFCAALLLGQRNGAVNIALDALSSGASPVEVYVELCSKALWQIGEMWERNEISVADEHRATAIVQYVVAQIYSRIPLHLQQRGNVIVTGVEGELHQLGGNIVADLLETEGWNVCFLGTNLPQRTILEKIEQHQAFAVFISATMPHNILRVRRLIAEIRARFGAKILIVLGGQAFVNATAFIEETGADVFAPTAAAGAAIIAEHTEHNPMTLGGGPERE